MKKTMKHFSAFVLSVLLCLGMMSMPVFAASESQDGLEVTLVTDKEAYNQEEQIVATLSVKNTNDFAVTNLLLENIIPDGYKLAENFVATKQVESLAAGESITLTITYVSEKSTGDNEEGEDRPGTGDADKTHTLGNGSNNGNSNADSPSTDDESNVTFWIVLMVLAILGIIVIVVINKKQGRKLLSLFLCLTMVGTVVAGAPMQTKAAGNDTKVLNVTETIKIGNQEVEVSAIVKYELPDSEVNTTYTVTFDSNGGSTVENQSVTSGEKVNIPPEPTREGYMFIGWFEDKDTEDWTGAFSFDSPIENNLTLYAIWVDVTTDTDQDGLSDDLEDYLGTGKETVDTDNDGLNDYKEEILFNYDSTKNDTDNDGVSDGDEDHDNDKLSNIWELANGTDPILRDTDNDNLEDYEEIYSYGTDPVNKDTDGDKANDGDEIRLGTNPLNFDSQFAEKGSSGELKESCQVSIEVEAIVAGEQVGTMEVRPVSYGENPVISPTIPGYIDRAYDISIDGQPQSAVLTFYYDTSVGSIGDDFQPRVYYYNEETKTFEELPNQTVSVGQVQVNVEHFSTYILLNKVEFDKVWENEIKPPEYDSTLNGLDVVFVIDSSGSMTDNDSNKLRLDAAQEFVQKLGENDRAAVIDFDSGARVYQEFTSDHELLNAAIMKVDSNGGTNLSNGINLAIQQFTAENYTRTDAYKYIIFLTDGDGSYSVSYTSLAAENGIEIYTIGLGSGVKESTLKAIADGTNGKYYFASTADVLIGIYDDIAGETIDYSTDSNNDGISDYYTELIKKGELPLSNGSVEFIGTDFNYNENGELSDDYDSDGLKNGDELIIKHSGDMVYMYMVSDPMMEHSDADGYSDYVEHQNGTNPMVSTYTASSIDYPWDDTNFTYINVYNEEDKWWNEGAREMWSAITFNWSHEDEAKRLLASFFDEYSNLNEIKDTTDSIAQEVANLMGTDLIAKGVELYKNGNLAYDAISELSKAVKNWQAAGNSARNLSSDHITQFKAQLSLFNYKYKFKGFSKADKIGMGVSFAIDEANDIYNWIQAYSAIVATQTAFQENQDILNTIKANDNAKEKFVACAADDILLVINDEYSKFKDEQAKDLEIATAENIASLALSMLSKTNPYILAVDLAIGLLDWLTPATKIAEATYCLYVIDELVVSTKDLFSYVSKNSSYYNILDENTRHIELLICSRIWGGEFAKNITGNQHYLGLFNDDKIRKEYADAINSENSALENYLNNFRN